MTPATYLTPQRQRLMALLAAFVLLAGQLFVQQHIHADDAPESGCVVCVQADHSPMAAPAGDPPRFCRVGSRVLPVLEKSTLAGSATTYLARAPPLF